MNIADAIATPNLCSMNGALIVEKNSNLSAKIPQLEAFGESVVQVDLVSGVTSVKRAAKGGWYGAADPRREGVASGLLK
jgi:gamma-glutamyltranspeptidase / glutathione hydrolase